MRKDDSPMSIGNDEDSAVSMRNSGPSSPVPHAHRQSRVAAESADKALRRYAASLERALSTWPISPAEWADYIAFLARLLKAIQAHTHPDHVKTIATHPDADHPPVLPQSSAIATRLAQCLNPALPAGVHQKALEVYSHLFHAFGHRFVSTHLRDILPGLLPVLSFASLSVRPLVYELFQSHIVRLPASHLRPALRSIILGLLPALEEGQGEDFDRAFAIMRTLGASFAPPDGYFWQCLFLAVVTSPSRRQGALHYLSRQLPKFSRQLPKASAPDSTSPLPHEAECVVSPEPGLLIRCFVCGLSDNQSLVQRDFLDLMVTHLPLDSAVLQEKAAADDLDRLVHAATQVVLRRDMGLNRRLWSWLLGPELNEPHEGGSQPTPPQLARKASGEVHDNPQLHYFTAYGQASLERCIMEMLNHHDVDPAQKSRPFRVCLALMDRWEIGGPLVPKIFLPAMRSLYEYSLTADRRHFLEVIPSAHVFFDGVEASLIWACLLGILRDALERGRSPVQNLDLFNWIINNFNIRDEEMLAVHLPYSALYMASYFCAPSVSAPLQLALIKASTKLLDLIPEQVFRSTTLSKAQLREAPDDVADDDIQKSLVDFYDENVHGADPERRPFSGSSTARLLYTRTTRAIVKALGESHCDIYAGVVAVLALLSTKTDPTDASSHDPFLRDALVKHFGPHDCAAPHLPFPILATTVSLLSALEPHETHRPISQADVAQMEPSLTAAVWRYMSPSQPKFHVEAVKAFWQLESLLRFTDAFTASVAALLPCAGETRSEGGRTNHHHKISYALGCNVKDRSETLRCFTVLWAHTIPPTGGGGRRSSSICVLTDSRQLSRARHILEQPLMRVLDALEHPQDPAFDVAKTWLGQLPSLEQVIRPTMDRLIGIDVTRDLDANPAERIRIRGQDDRLRDLDYCLGQLENLLVHGNAWTWQCFLNTAIPRPAGHEESSLVILANTCVEVLFSAQHSSATLNRRSISVLGVLLSSSAASELRTLDLDTRLLDALEICMKSDMHGFQGDLLALIRHALKIRLAGGPLEDSTDHVQPVHSPPKRPSTAFIPRPDLSTSNRTMTSAPPPPPPPPPPQLLERLRMGFASPQSRYHLDKWLSFLADVLATFSDAIVAGLLPLVETVLGELRTCHQQLASLSTRSGAAPAPAPEAVAVAMSLFEGLEMVLDRAYDCLLQETAGELPGKEPDSSRTSFLSNVAAGMFRTEGPPSRTAPANKRLAVILAFHDAIRVAMAMWLWASHASSSPDCDHDSAATTAYNALKVRNKTRHVIQQLFSLEPLESLEVVVAHWCNAASDDEAASTISLLHAMPVTRPQSMVPAALDALCTRANAPAVAPARQSSVTVELQPSEIATFLAAYLGSTEDDALDEIWPDCIAFLRDVLADPLPYRQVLPHLLSIVLLLAEKLSNTNFGEQRKMRRDLGDLFQRLLTATLTTLPSGDVGEPADHPSGSGCGGSRPRRTARAQSMRLVPVLHRITARLDVVLDGAERMTSAVSNISQNLVAPALRAKAYPRNVTSDLLGVVVNMSRQVPGAKAWRKEVADAFYDPRLLACSADVVKHGWFPLLHQWSLHDKERVPELLSRLAAPSAAGLMFGGGSSAGRLEADRKAQLNLRRIGLLLLASPGDTYAAQMAGVQEKTSDLFDASPASSPSAAIKAELFLLCRALALSVSTSQLAPLWPTINHNLQAALRSLRPDAAGRDEFTNLTLLHACKLLDLLVALSPDDFQLHEWLYVSNTVDAVYRPEGWTPAALADQVADGLGSAGGEESVARWGSGGASTGRRRPFLCDTAAEQQRFKAMPQEDFVRAVIRPFLSHVSIHAYEGVYSMDVPSTHLLRDDLLADLLDLGSTVE